MNDTNLTEDNSSRHKGSRAWQIIRSVLKVVLLLILISTLFSVSAAAGYVASLVHDEPIRTYDEIYEKIFSNDQTSFAYFQDQVLIGKLRSEEDRTIVSKDKVSPQLINAMIAAEDKNFHVHHGIDIGGLTRAVKETMLGSPVQTGGSTLTQQLIKQTILGTEVTYERKAKEIFLALRLERMFSKDQILEAYINKMYFGKSANGTNIYGIQAAAKGIFGVDAENLNIAQAAYIAGMLQAPSRYIPFEPNGLKTGLERQKIVLDRMLENQFISQQQYNDSLAYDIKAHLAQASEKSYSSYPHLMMEIEERAAQVLVDQEIAKDPKLNQSKMAKEEYREWVDKKRQEVLRGGYRIYTTIDQKIYNMMTAIAENPKNFGANRSYTIHSGKQAIRIENALEEVGATLIDNKTGAILGFIGGRDFDVSQVNHTTRPRQPGSAMKPLAAFGPAFDKGLLQPGSWIEDAPIALENGSGKPPFYPSNYDNRFHGYITAREALAKSYNIPAIKTYLQVGIPESLSYVKKMGVTTIVTPEDNPQRNDYQAKTGVIGGLTQGVTVEEITGAYSVFPNQGVILDPYMIQRIEDANGKAIYEHVSAPAKVLSEQAAYLMTDMMKTVVSQGTAASLKTLVGTQPEMAGKTGTTNDNYDSWFVGFTPEVTLGVWIGYDIPYSLPNDKPSRSLSIWAKIMKNLLALDPERYPKNAKFAKPAGIVSAFGEIYDQKYVPKKKVERPGSKKDNPQAKTTQTKPNDPPPANVQTPKKEDAKATSPPAANKGKNKKKKEKPKKNARSQNTDPLQGIIPPDPTQ